MISWLKGEIIHTWEISSKKGIVLNVDGVGYEIQLLPTQICKEEDSKKIEFVVPRCTCKDAELVKREKLLASHVKTDVKMGEAHLGLGERVGAGAQQDARDGGGIVEHRGVERRPAVLGLGPEIGAGLDELPRHVRVALGGGEVEGGVVARARGLVDARAPARARV